MLPEPSLYLNIPKTGSTFTNWFFDAADWLEFKRLCRLNHLTVPNRASLEIVKRIKRHCLEYGNLNYRFWDYHTGYSTLPGGIRHYPSSVP